MAEQSAKLRRVLPGFGLSLGYTVLYLSLIVLVPLSAVLLKSLQLTWAEFKSTVTSDPVMAAFTLSFGASAVAAVVNVVMGLLIAWVLARYNFFGRKFLDSLIDLPFALPTAVAGITLTTIYSDTGWIGSWLAKMNFQSPWIVWRGFSESSGATHVWPWEIHWWPGVAGTPLGVIIALIFVGLPFVVRTVQPVLQDLSREVEEAAASLGATRMQTFRKVIFPEIAPAILTGFALAFARSLGEYGSIAFISGNLPMETEIAPTKIIQELETNHYSQATSIALVMLVASFTILFGINLLQRVLARRGGA